jgi:hypothetical protein
MPQHLPPPPIYPRSLRATPFHMVIDGGRSFEYIFATRQEAPIFRRSHANLMSQIRQQKDSFTPLIKLVTARINQI